MGHKRPTALQKRLGQGQTYSPDRDRMLIQPWEIADAADRVHRGAREVRWRGRLRRARNRVSGYGRLAWLMSLAENDPDAQARVILMVNFTAGLEPP
jgi:hypothetical protein